MPERAERTAPRGKDRGDIEIALGGVTAAVSATLVGLGVYSAWRAATIREYCMEDPVIIEFEMPDPAKESVCNDLTQRDPVRSSAVSSALSFAFAVPIAVGSGFLLRKGLRMRREYKRVQGLSIGPWAPGWRGAGVSVGFAF